METKIGKYRIIEDDQSLKIIYQYTISDLIGSIWFLLTFLLGLLLLYVSHSFFVTENVRNLNAWVTGVTGLWFFLFGGYLLVMAAHNPGNGIFEVDKKKRVLVIRDFLKSEIMAWGDVVLVFYKIERNLRPTSAASKYAIIGLKLKDGNTKECFIVRSHIPFDIGRKVDKDLHIVSRALKDRVSNSMKVK
jgi:hypothetical protein